MPRYLFCLKAYSCLLHAYPMSGTLLTNPQNPTAKKVGILIPILPKRNRRELK